MTNADVIKEKLAPFESAQAAGVAARELGEERKNVPVQAGEVAGILQHPFEDGGYLGISYGPDKTMMLVSNPERSNTSYMMRYDSEAEAWEFSVQRTIRLVGLRITATRTARIDGLANTATATLHTGVYIRGNEYSSDKPDRIDDEALEVSREVHAAIQGAFVEARQAA